MVKILFSKFNGALRYLKILNDVVLYTDHNHEINQSWIERIPFLELCIKISKICVS